MFFAVERVGEKDMEENGAWRNFGSYSITVKFLEEIWESTFQVICQNSEMFSKWAAPIILYD